MRIRSEKFSGIHTYRDMPPNERAFLTSSDSGSYEFGRHLFWFQIRKKYFSYKSPTFEIWVDNNGTIELKVDVRSKNGKTLLSAEDLVNLVSKILKWAGSAARNGFLDVEEDDE